jgi:uncharacterized membrane protein
MISLFLGRQGVKSFMERSGSKPWQAILTPHRSLSRQGFIIVMALIAAVNFAVGALFMAIGAWPVAGFAGLDVLLMWWAFRANFADGRRLERISVTDHEVILDCLSEGRQPEQKRFVRQWVKVELQEDRERELIGSLSLVAGANRTVIGEFLAPEERKTLAQALRRAVAIPRI